MISTGGGGGTHTQTESTEDTLTHTYLTHTRLPHTHTHLPHTYTDILYVTHIDNTFSFPVFHVTSAR